MQVIRTIVWVVLLIALLLFSLNNWTTIPIKIWEDLVWETKLPALVLIAFMLGLLPMWFVHLTGRWRLQRRINSLEAMIHQPSPALTSTQLEAASSSASADFDPTPPSQTPAN